MPGERGAARAGKIRCERNLALGNRHSSAFYRPLLTLEHEFEPPLICECAKVGSWPKSVIGPGRENRTIDQRDIRKSYVDVYNDDLVAPAASLNLM